MSTPTADPRVRTVAALLRASAATRPEPTRVDGRVAVQPEQVAVLILAELDRAGVGVSA